VKKLSLIALVLSVVLLTACEGDDPSGPGGTLEVVTGLVLGATSAGNTVVLAWTTYGGSETIDGYEVYFKAENTGETWTALGTTTTTGYEHIASVAGGYSVRAYEGTNYSSAYATPVDVMPNIISTEYTIYDNFAPADYHSGIYFGATSATTGLASSTSFYQDIYAYDESKGDNDVWFYSGTYGVYGNGNPTWMYAPSSEYGYCPVYTSGASGWWNNGQLYTTDDVIFAHLDTGQYIKIYIDSIFPEPISANGTGVTLHYEFQEITGLTLFTDDH
jgi:hypothetical protein